MTRAMFGLPLGASRDNPQGGAKFARDVIKLGAGQTQTVYTSPTGDDGSAANFYGWQSVFVDNSLNDRMIEVVFTGTMSSKKIPARSQGFIPAACPNGQFSIRILCASGSAVDIPIELWSKEIGPSIWGVGA